ncbi:sulfite exporter TauE/SafE family protein [Flavobacteriaceae bacterium S356]|uniref:Sulfite exporter TauE/SafE family protein n=1 Tax=Asprobacillus argus TaxID=3076534 RepID=A0ABU3LIC5_9FLAO|nr:sulfite exporter TauE/SafE family protein [Flavobacteriaceae bacterium S356]
MLVSGFILGLFGSLHCVGMCGPIAFMLPVDRKNKWIQLWQIISYHVGRLISYGLLGMLFGLLGKSFYFFGFQQQLSIVVGAIMILSILVPSVFKKFSITKPIFAFTHKVQNRLGQELKKKRNNTFLTIGFLNGLLPCGLVYMAIFGALTMSTVTQGVFYMALFGAGTIPLMTSVVYMAKFTNRIQRKKIRKLIPVVVVCMGVLFVLRGLGLGIPYVSPEPVLDLVNTTMQCH